VRNYFAKRITEWAQKDERIVLLSGDIGNRLFDKFKESCPGRFYNCGVAEANMVGVAAGMAMQGLRPVCYTIAPFLTYRAMEQIRVDLGYHHLPVILVGTGGGLSYASLGGTHHSCEELGMLRLIPGMNVAAPGDDRELEMILSHSLASSSPTYIRIGKKGEPQIHPSPLQATPGQPLRLRTGKNVALVACGTILPEVVAAAEQLEKKGISASVFSQPYLKPFADQEWNKIFQEHRLVVSVEEHSRLGGLGAALAEWKADKPKTSPLVRLGSRDEFLHRTTDQEGARKYFQLDAEGVIRKTQEAWRGVAPA
jgi:transketolase